jgi:hypothetical protein
MAVKTRRVGDPAPEPGTAVAPAIAPPDTSLVLAPEQEAAKAKAEAEAALAAALALERERLDLAQAGKEVHLELWDGRAIVMRRPQAVYIRAHYRLLSEDQGNQALDLISHGIFHLVSVDGEAIHAPTTQNDMDHVYGILHNTGVEQVGAFYVRYFAARGEAVRPL